jgi:hypothetical protein
LNDQVKEEELGRICSGDGGEEECRQDLYLKARREENTRKTKTWLGDNIKMHVRDTYVFGWYGLD